MPIRVNAAQLTIGLLCLAAGALEYLTGRLGNAYFLAPFEGLSGFFRRFPSPFGAWGDFAPDFFHPLGFALVTMAVAPRGRRWRLGLSLAWLAIDAAFEFGQKYGARIAAYVPEWFDKVPVLDQVEAYFTRGAYDGLDLIAIAAGCLAAFLIGEITRGREERVRELNA